MPYGFDPLARILQNFFEGDYANQDFIDWHNERMIEKRKKATERKRDKGIEESFPGLNEREKMLLEHEMSKRLSGAPGEPPEAWVRPPGVRPASPPDPVNERVEVPVYNPRQFQGAGDYVDPSTAVAAREPWEVEHEENFQRFKEMNPDLDWGRAAEQSGGNVPGGNFSAMASTITYTPTEMDKQLFDFVENQVPQMEIRRKLDPRSRAYDPEGAELMIRQMADKQDAAAQMIYSKAQQQRAQTEANEIAIAKQRADFMRSPQGQIESTVSMILQNIDPTTNPDIYNSALKAQIAISQGDYQRAAELLQGVGAAATTQSGGEVLVSEGGKLR